MQTPTESVSPREAAAPPAGTAVVCGAEPLRAVASPAGPRLVYDLRIKDGRSDRFFDDVARFSGEVLARIEQRAGTVVDGYSRHVQVNLCEAGRSRGEYALEFLTLGMTLRRYEGAAERTPRWVVALTEELYWWRSRSTRAKPLVDLARAAIARFVLAPNIGRKAEARGSAAVRLTRLSEWLYATGEFEQEVMRLHNWRSYLATLAPWEALGWMAAATELFDSFKRDADTALGGSTRGVEDFLATEYARRGCREDLLFCGKTAAEYHLNMVAAEVMNQGLREGFDRTARKIVLVPACMRGVRVRNCRARVRGVDILCAACDPDCAVNRISRRMRALGATVYLVSHSTGFSRWLARWQREPEVGVAAVACLLNILPGGYEMRARGIASQCVPLDYPGCQKHWNAKGIVTAVNEERLVQIVARPATR